MLSLIYGNYRVKCCTVSLHRFRIEVLKYTHPVLNFPVWSTAVSRFIFHLRAVSCSVSQYEGIYMGQGKQFVAQGGGRHSSCLPCMNHTFIIQIKCLLHIKYVSVCSDWPLIKCLKCTQMHQLINRCNIDFVIWLDSFVLWTKVLIKSRWSGIIGWDPTQKWWLLETSFFKQRMIGQGWK